MKKQILPTLPDLENVHFSRRELAERWKCSTETIKRRQRAGLLKTLHNGRLIRITLSEVLRFEADAQA